LNEDLGCAKIDGEIADLLAGFYCSHQKTDAVKLSKREKEEILAFAYNHKDMLLNQEGDKVIRLYYNFVHPPFSKTVTTREIKTLTDPWEKELARFVNELTDKAGNLKDIDVICTGGGFEMPWARKKISSIFAKGKPPIFYKNPKGILAQGATLYAARELSLLPKININIEDSHKLPHDVGINIMQGGKNRFHTLLERGSWLWQKPKTAYLILKDDAAEIQICTRDNHGKVAALGVATLKDLPQRPVGTTRIALSVEAKTAGSYAVNIKDLGFGEIFPASEYEENFVFEGSGKI